MLEFIYCEGLGPLGAFPGWNLASSAVFLALAAAVWTKPHHSSHRFGLLAIGAGSLVWHASLHRAGLALDIGSIVIWAALYTRDLRRVLAAEAGKAYPILLLVLALSALCAWALAPGLPMLSGAFVPYLAITLGLSFPGRLPRPARTACAMGAGAMLMAIIAREADLALCESLGGSHWLWHLLAGLSLLAPLRVLDHYCSSAGPKRV